MLSRLAANVAGSLLFRAWPALNTSSSQKPDSITTTLDNNVAQDNSPTISGTDVVFVSDRVGGVDNIFQMDALSPAPVALTNTAIFAIFPDVSGGVRAWNEFVLATGDVETVAKIGNGTPFSIGSNSVRPSVSGTSIAYLMDGEIFIYDTLTTITTPVVVHPGFSKDIVLLNGTDILFTDASSGNQDIYFLQMSTGFTFPLTTDPSDQVLTDVDGSRIVYHDNRFGNRNVWTMDYVTYVPEPSLNALLLAGVLFILLTESARSRKSRGIDIAGIAS